MFNLVRNCWIFFQSNSIILFSIQQWMSVSPISLSTWIVRFFVFLILVILIGMQCYLTVVLICISPMANGAELLFMCLFAICILFLPSFYWVVFLLLSVKVFKYKYSGSKSFVGYVISKYFLPVCGFSLP